MKLVKSEGGKMSLLNKHNRMALLLQMLYCIVWGTMTSQKSLYMFSAKATVFVNIFDL